MIFTNAEWKKYINNESVQHSTIPLNSKYRLHPKLCERWYNQDDGATKFARRCPNDVVYRSDQTGIYFCRYCARQIVKINANNNADLSFTKVT